ncbi:MAG: 30S ribosomal protein S19 [Candidatus Nanoarchaeia archaeon]|nr:30S ribosomal protein S19 [Candidatus Nanoarchaeia archaeon]
MALKEFRYKGKTEAELKQLDTKQLMAMLPSRKRRSLKRGFTDAQKALLDKIKKFREGKRKKPVKTHCRDMIILPEMIGLTIHIHNGKEFKPIAITAEMIGLYLGELSHTRQKIVHSAPGIGATKSSSVATK